MPPAIEDDRRFWRRHLGWPLVALGLAFLILQVSGLDLRLTDAFFDPVSGRFPAAQGFWARTVMHTGGKRFIYLIALGWLVVLVVGALPQTRRVWAPWRRAALYVLACLVVTPAIVGLLKQHSDTPCPAHSQRYGGPWPAGSLLGPAPVDLPGRGCFPGAHSSAAFALFGLYFVHRRARPVLARRLLVGVAALGGLYAVAQSARGAHILSHDLVSATIAWVVAVLLYRVVWRGRLHPDDEVSPAR